MRKLILSSIVLLAFVASNNLQAQKITEKTTSNSKTIRTEKEDIKMVKHDGITYYIFNSTWHTKMKNRYVLRGAPKGAKINFKPADGKYVTMHGKKYYKCKGIFYKEHKDSIYEVVRI